MRRETFRGTSRERERISKLREICPEVLSEIQTRGTMRERERYLTLERVEVN